MKIDKISNTNFESKKFITDNMRCSIESILLKMNCDTKRVQDGDHFITTINNKLNFNNNKAVFEDERRLKEKLPIEKQMQGFSSLKLGKKTVLDINNESGEIIDCFKPIYKPFFMVLKQAEKVFSEIRTNFNLPQVVSKEYLTIHELTPDGHKKMKKFVLQIEKQRLENILKDLEETSK